MPKCDYCPNYFRAGNWNRAEAHVCSDCRPAHRANLQRLRRMRKALKVAIYKATKLNEKIRELEGIVKLKPSRSRRLQY